MQRLHKSKSQANTRTEPPAVKKVDGKQMLLRDYIQVLYEGIFFVVIVIITAVMVCGWKELELKCVCPNAIYIS